MKVNTIYNGDAYELIKQIPDKSIDLIVTDPPYLFKKLSGKSGIFKDRERTYLEEIKEKGLDKGIDYSILNDFCRVLKKINIYIWCNKEQLLDYLKFFVEEKKCNFEILIWAKTNPPPFSNGHYLKDKEYCLYFWEKNFKFNGKYEDLKTVYFTGVNQSDKKLYDHPTIKPLSIIENLIKNSSVEGGVVLDPFLGSGTTAVACKELNRQYIGFEIDKKYYDIANDRLKGINQLIKAKGYEQIKLF